MINPDPVINGYSRSVILHLIKTLQDRAADELRMVKQTGLAAKEFSRKEAPFIRILGKWMDDDIKEFKTIPDVQDFLLAAFAMLNILTPKE